MWCSEVRERLVAWRDDELGASERQQVEEHVRSCPSCSEHDRRLIAARPRPPRMRAPADIEARLARALDPALLRARAAAPAPTPPSTWARIRGHLARPAPVSRGAALGYLVLLAVTFGWGLSTWWTGGTRLDPGARAGGDIPAGQFRPASYEPGKTDPR